MRMRQSMQLSVSLNGGGLTWSSLKILSSSIEHGGYSAIYCSDHFDRLDPWVALTYLATHSRTVQIGTLVSPLSFRDPITLARNASAINELSKGRCILGAGAGWAKAEHDAFGFDLGDMRLRMARFTEGVEVIAQLLRSDAPVSFSGRYFQLKGARLFPPVLQKVPILVGGTGPKHTLPIVARFADIWNCQLATVAAFKERNAQLDVLLSQAGRSTDEVKQNSADSSIVRSRC